MGLRDRCVRRAILSPFLLAAELSSRVVAMSPPSPLPAPASAKA